MSACESRSRETGGLRWLARLLAVALVICVAPAAAFAHAALIATDPADGAVLAQSPARFSLTFSEPVSPLVLNLVRPDGTVLPLTAFHLDDHTVVVDNPAPLARGTHVLSWRVVSADGHPVAGSILFSLGAPSAAPAATESVDWNLRAAIWLARVALYAGLFLGIGGAFALSFLAGGGRDGKRFVATALLAGLAAAPLSLGLQGLDALGAPLTHILTPAIWRAALETTFRFTIWIALAALLLGLLALMLPRAGKVLSLAALLGTGLALAASGHAGAADPQWLMRSMVFLHGIGIAFWCGALAPLGLALKRRAPGATAFLRRFSFSILPVVAILVIAGVVLAIVQVGTPSALLTTAYGNLLSAKLVLLAGLFSLAALNRWKLTAPAEASHAGSSRNLVRSIGVEIFLVLAVFGVAAGWRFTPPPRALALAAAQPAAIHIHTAKAMADLSLAPGHTGPVTASIMLMTGDFGPLDAKAVTLVLSKPDSGIEAIRREAHKAGDGTWRVDGLVVPLAGRWMVRLDILVSDFDMVTLKDAIAIRP
nr:copper resistance protein CopC [Pseudaminobacter manganicus]